MIAPPLPLIPSVCTRTSSLALPPNTSATDVLFPKGHSPFVAVGKNYSETKAAQIDDEIKRFVDEAHQRVRKILSERRTVLDDLARLLSQKESVQGEELRQMMSNSTSPETAN